MGAATDEMTRKSRATEHQQLAVLWFHQHRHMCARMTGGDCCCCCCRPNYLPFFVENVAVIKQTRHTEILLSIRKKVELHTSNIEK
jgi:hypothetical protein